jgi:pyruvate/2-oxoglutarate/acetoin dehydrogenase E1 component
MTWADRISEAIAGRCAVGKTKVIGYNCRFGSRAYGMLRTVPDQFIQEMPVDEALMAGVAVGQAVAGQTPILIFERLNFAYNAIDELVNHMDKIQLLSRGEFTCPLTVLIVTHHPQEDFRLGQQHTTTFTEMDAVSGLFNCAYVDDELPLVISMIRRNEIDSDVCIPVVLFISRESLRWEVR